MMGTLVVKRLRRESAPEEKKNCSKCRDVRNMEVRIMGSHLKEFVKELSPYRRYRWNKRDVRTMGSRIIETLLLS